MATENRYILELDGFGTIYASEATVGSKEHTPVELYVGNQPSPFLLRGNFKINELTFKHAHSLGSAADDAARWMDDYVDGIDVSKRGGRFIVLDEAGVTPIANWELRGCVPTKFQPETHGAANTNPSFFTLGLRPENMVKL